MIKKFEFILFIPIFIALYIASGSGNIIIGSIGIGLLVLNALAVLFADEFKAKG